MSKSPTVIRWPLGIIGGFLLLILIAGLVALLSRSSAGGASTGGTGALKVAENSWDFGDVSQKNGVVTKEIALTNDSGEPATINRLETSCMCTSATIVHADGRRSQTKGMVGHGGGTPYLTETIAPGEAAKVVVAFDPNAHGPAGIGAIRRTVTLGIASPTTPTITLNFSGNVTP